LRGFAPLREGVTRCKHGKISNTLARPKKPTKAAPGKVKARPLTDGNGEILRRIAERAGAPRAACTAAPISTRRCLRLVSGEHRLAPVRRVNRVEMSLLKGIDRVRDLLVENTERFARGLPANNALLWGARGMGKSSLVKAAHAGICAAYPKAGLKLIEIHREDIESLPELMGLLRNAPQRFIVFCDDLSFDADDTSYKSLKTMLEGGIEGRPDNVIFYATSNRRHLLAREMMENERSTAINPGEAVEEKVSLSDRFGLWLGFHRCSQDEYLAMVEGYIAHSGCRSGHRPAPRGAGMGDDARRALRPRRLAIRAGSRRTARREDGKLNVASGNAMAYAPLRYCAGSTGVEPLRISKCSCGDVTLPVWPDLRNHLTALDRIAALHQDFAGVRIGGDEAVAVTDQHQIAVALELIAGIGDDAVFGRLDRRAFRHREIDAVVLQSVRRRTEAGDDAAATGQRKPRQCLRALRS
jgi:predicted AAA+ superfamily ATPase